ncbi:hypothetical protein [Compostimonas suwonensis]|uniref:DNA modification methylase n=1 Tax=Compostimonas suwonensis TaxID=1048394 RepID=A0A2M9BVH5_9MICO|nr:hypothetical protein [Compostimonas suwonensis]PJJ61949.1 hypothetical protein CLV54_1738 [Compostimonas suwonensis]
MKARIAASVILAGGLLLGTTGCGFIAPQATTYHYDASDGVSGNVGSIDVRNAILISDNGELANLLVTLVNPGAESRSITIQYEAGGKKFSDSVTVPAGETTQIGTPDNQLFVLRNIDSQPGSLFPVYFQYGDEPGKKLLVPVLTNGLEEYKDLTPVDAVTDKVIDDAKN